MNLPDWSSSCTKAEQHLKRASDAFLLRNWKEGRDQLMWAQRYLDDVKAWVILEGKD